MFLSYSNTQFKDGFQFYQIWTLDNIPVEKSIYIHTLSIRFTYKLRMIQL